MSYKKVIRPTNNHVLQRVMGMVYDPKAKKIADKYGLNIVNISWEDNARDKNSAFGPCISDMTLCVARSNLPIIRYNNFTDLTWDVEMKKIPIVVGNEKGHELKVISLHKYLKNFDQYLHEKVDRKINLLRKKDSHVIMSSQACFLPIEKNEVEFNVSIYNYQSSKTSPSVLTIVSCVSGTSASIHDGGYKSLYFNKDGQKCSFIGQRLSDNRKQKGEVDLGKPMTSEEKQQNVLLIIQVPIRKIRSKYFMEGSSMAIHLVEEDVEIGVNPSDTVYELKLKIHEIFGTKLENISLYLHGQLLENAKDLSYYNIGDMAPISTKAPILIPSIPICSFSCSMKHKVVEDARMGELSDVENVIVKIGESDGKFEELKGYNFERDNRFPVRVTLQYYKATSNGVINDNDVKEIYEQIQSSKKNADFIGSLVVSDSNRPTEHKVKKYKIPIWWDDFWLIHQSKLSRFTKKTAEEFIFKNGRFTDMGMSECQDEILTLIKTHPENNLPKWNIV